VKNFPVVGRLGDRTNFKGLPNELIREDIAQSFGLDSGVVAEAGAVMVCGSPFEVATNHNLKSGPKNLGGFDMETAHNNTSYRKQGQRNSIWVDIAFKAPDQLRQRMAHALSQILVVSPDSISDNYFTESFLSYYDILVRHAFGNYLDILREVTYHPLMAEMLTYINGEVSVEIVGTTKGVSFMEQNLYLTF
jgi:cullin-associated NEDD8-dissociated protein 1